MRCSANKGQTHCSRLLQKHACMHTACQYWVVSKMQHYTYLSSQPPNGT